MTKQLGTRGQSRSSDRIESRRMTKGYTRDIGLSTNVTASLTFNAGTGQVTASAGTFAAFKTEVPVLVENTQHNNGYFVVTATDTSTYLTLSPPPTTEGPVTATLRTV
jgi:hypothetical protein